MLAKDADNFLIGGQAQGAQQHGGRQLTGAVHTSINAIVNIGFIFNPSAAVRNNSGAIQLFTAGINVYTIIYAGRTHQLADDNTLSTVDNKGTGFGHQGEITHENGGFLNFAGILIY